MTNEKALPLSEDASARAAIAAQMADLTDLLLDGYRAQLERMGAGGGAAARQRRKAVLAQYERDRRELIMALVERGFHDPAASLAEKYLEFAALIALCEAAGGRGGGGGGRARLDSYMETFASHGFAEFVFAWHVREGKQAKLLREVPAERRRELGTFLRQGHAR